MSADRYSAWTRQKTTLFSGHYLRNRSTLDICVLVISVYFNIRNTLPKSGTFLLGHPVYTPALGAAATTVFTVWPRARMQYEVDCV